MGEFGQVRLVVDKKDAPAAGRKRRRGGGDPPMGAIGAGQGKSSLRRWSSKPWMFFTFGSTESGDARRGRGDEVPDDGSCPLLPSSVEKGEV
jgi:hypothetical protein